MKGNFFAKPLEYKLDVNGESWQQGSMLQGSLIIANHGAETILVKDLGIHLCFGNNKKIKAKDGKAFEVIDSKLPDTETILSKSETSIDFNFALNSNAPITEKTQSLYLVCGDINHPFDGGMLELNIAPIKAVSDFMEIFQTFFKFKFKTLKNKKDWVAVQVTPPDSKDWVNIQKLNLHMKVEDQKLNINFIFNLKKLSFDSTLTGTKDSKLEVPIIMEKKDYLTFGDSPNQVKIMKVIEEVLDQVKLKKII